MGMGGGGGCFKVRAILIELPLPHAEKILTASLSERVSPVPSQIEEAEEPSPNWRRGGLIL